MLAQLPLQEPFSFCHLSPPRCLCEYRSVVRGHGDEITLSTHLSETDSIQVGNSLIDKLKGFRFEDGLIVYVGVASI